MEIYIALLVCIIGLIMFIVTPGPNPPPPSPGNYGQKANVIGLHMFWVGLFVFLMQLGPAMTGFAGHVR